MSSTEPVTLPDHPHLARGEQRQAVLRAAMPRVTPLVDVGFPFLTQGRRVLAKLERYQHTGSMAYRAALAMTQAAIASGELRPGQRIVESTSGSFGVAIAQVARLYDHPVTLIVDEKLEEPTKRELEEAGAELHLATTDDPNTVVGLTDRMLARSEYVRSLAPEPCWIPDQYNNPENPKAYEPMAAEIVEQLKGVEPYSLVAPVGTGGSSQGVGSYLKERFPRMEVLGVDTVGSTVFGQPPGDRIMTGMGGDAPMGNVNYELYDGGVHLMDPATAIQWARKLQDKCPLAAGGWSVASTLAAAIWEANERPPEATVVAIFPDGAERYQHTLYNNRSYPLSGLLGMGHSEPLMLDTTADYPVGQWAYAQRAVAHTLRV